MNIADKILRATLFGRDATCGKDLEGRSKVIEFGIAKDGEKYRRYVYRNDDGFILTLIEMIEKLEDRIFKLENNTKIKK